MSARPDSVTFVPTTEYQRFAEMCDAGREDRSVVFCLGAAGVGKTAAARHYANCDGALTLVAESDMVSLPDDPENHRMIRTALYTPRTTDTPKKVERDLAALFWRMPRLTHAEPIPNGEPRSVPASCSSLGIDLLIVDEVRRLSPVGLSVLRDLFDQHSLGLVFLAHPGWEKTRASQHLFASRLGFLHTFRELDLPNGQQFFEAQVQRLGLRVEEDAEEVFLQKTQGNVAAMCLILYHLLFLAHRREAFLVTGAVIEEVAHRIWPNGNGGFR